MDDRHDGEPESRVAHLFADAATWALPCIADGRHPLSFAARWDPHLESLVVRLGIEVGDRVYIRNVFLNLREFALSYCGADYVVNALDRARAEIIGRADAEDDAVLGTMPRARH